MAASLRSTTAPSANWVCTDRADPVREAWIIPEFVKPVFKTRFQDPAARRRRSCRDINRGERHGNEHNGEENRR